MKSLLQCQIDTLTAQLTSLGVPTRLTSPLIKWAKLESDVGRTPTDLDIRWGSQPDEPQIDHLLSVGTQPISARSLVGGQYTLTPAQRAILRERYGLTPTTTVEVTNKVRHSSGVVTALSFRSCLHVDPRHRTRMLTAVTLSNWGQFCDAVAQLEAAFSQGDVAGSKSGKPTSTKGPSDAAKRRAELEALY